MSLAHGLERMPVWSAAFGIWDRAHRATACSSSALRRNTAEALLLGPPAKEETQQAAPFRDVLDASLMWPPACMRQHGAAACAGSPAEVRVLIIKRGLSVSNCPMQLPLSPAPAQQPHPAHCCRMARGRSSAGAPPPSTCL